MAASPVYLPSFQISPQVTPRSAGTKWIPVIGALLFVCFTSTTFMGGSHTQIVVNAVWRALFGHWHYDLTGVVNGDGRKIGHFLGYGSIGLLFRRAWHASMRAALALNGRLLYFSAALGVVSTLVIASLDEWHQRFLPGRVGCFRDVMVDTCGALFLNTVFLCLTLRNRRKQIALEASSLSSCESVGC